MTVEQGVVNLSVDYFKSYGPTGIVFLLLVLHFLDTRGWLPQILNRNGRFKYTGNGQKEIGEIKVALEKRTTYKWAEEQFKELKEDIKRDLDNSEKHLADRIASIHKRIDRIEK